MKLERVNAVWQKQKASPCAVMLQCISSAAQRMSYGRKSRWWLHHISSVLRGDFTTASGKKDVETCLMRWERRRLVLINGSAPVPFVPVFRFLFLTECIKHVHLHYISMPSNMHSRGCVSCAFVISSILQHIFIIVLRFESNNWEQKWIHTEESQKF